MKMYGAMVKDKWNDKYGEIHLLCLLLPKMS
jgi:hypothetical protein